MGEHYFWKFLIPPFFFCLVLVAAIVPNIFRDFHFFEIQGVGDRWDMCGIWPKWKEPLILVQKSSVCNVGLDSGTPTPKIVMIHFGMHFLGCINCTGVSQEGRAAYTM